MSQNNFTTRLHAGIDVAKATLQLSLDGASHSLANDPKGHARILQLLAAAETARPGRKVHVILEATAGYEAALCAALHAAGRTLSVIQPSRARHLPAPNARRRPVHAAPPALCAADHPEPARGAHRPNRLAQRAAPPTRPDEVWAVDMQYQLATVTTLVICAVIYVFSKADIFAPQRLSHRLRVRVTNDVDYDTAFRAWFTEHLLQHELISVESIQAGMMTELRYHVSLRDAAKPGGFVAALQQVNGNNRVLLTAAADSADMGE